MGLSASQARYLMLVAKQSDLQYQGQQINNERTVLSQQVSELYNSLLSMEVPTPPSTTEFQKVKYSGAIGSAQYSFYADSVKPVYDEDSKLTSYTITIGVTAYGDSIVPGIEQDAKKVGDTYQVAGVTVTAVDSNYETAIKNAQLKDASGKDLTANDFYQYTTTTTDTDGKTVTTVRFVLKTDLAGITEEGGRVPVYSYSPNGQYTRYEDKEGCQLTFDTSTGRITDITMPVGSSTQTMKVSASTETDEAAYQDAFAQYEYKKYLYDKEQQEINAKTEVIQQEDRNLELKLQRLDTENNEIKTELDAVKEVMKNNVESSYKTFSG